ncbi:vWA domain-containing protein [Fluviicola chungangensis]|uniref:VWA domain-containing protein n=1 Tax=Fluviicola chungangensis TaxID=2597671 RepID=A0A556MQ00_9FLAO|nr:VWA domain-containing protein [Fluviicola chungangensis]TSJ42027.1 VWA domain-containing protein [Fluviicola chungangensis]
MRILAIVYVVLSCGFLHGQQSNSEDYLDYGAIDKQSKRYIDLNIGNPGDDKVYILRVEHSPEVTYRLTSDLIQPLSTVQLRIQVNPSQKGDFNYVLKLYMSDQVNPVIYRLTGTVTEELPDDNYLTKCPDFNAIPAGPNSPSELTIITINKATKEPLSKSTVSIIHNGQPSGTWITGRLGKFSEKLPPGFFYFVVSKEGYLTKEAGIYVGPEISEITIPLSQNPAYDPPVPTKEPIPEPQEIAQQLPPKEAQEKLNEQMTNESIDTTTQKVMPELVAIPAENFDPSYFKDVNVVFVLDISSSMKMGEKMDLMKYSLNQLVSKLRPQDKMGLVTYANSAEVFQSSTSGDHKEELQKSISNLKPIGMTAGGKGIKLGYKEVMKSYDPNKANMVIIITDGAFNKDSEDYQKTVQKYAKDGIVFSVVGIQTREKDAHLMEEAAHFGNGRFVPIQKLADAHSNLTQEIRIASFKGAKKN